MNISGKCAGVSGGNTKSSGPKQSRNWCFTDFKDLNWESIYENNKEIIRYLIVGKETCPSTNKQHNQGWLQFYNKKRLGGVKRIIANKSIHLEACRGSEYNNDIYCQKEGKYKSYGQFISQGHRSDLEEIKHRLDNQEKLYEIAQDHFGSFLRYHKGFEKYKQLVEKEKTKNFRKINVTVISGPTGCGKTKAACEGNNYYKIEGDSLEWFDGYNGEKTLVIDEYSNQIKITKLLNLLDGYQLRLPIKGGFTYANWDTVFITTNLKEDELHPQAKEEHIKALRRRITNWDQLY